MQNAAASRFEFIAHALRGDGPFRPVTGTDHTGAKAILQGETYLVRYSRESDEKFARRNQLAYFASPLARVTQRFIGYLSEKPPVRDIPHELYQAIVADADGKGNSLDVFWQSFMFDARARGSMFFLVDMPRILPATLDSQIEQRKVPFLSSIAPESVLEYELGQDGKLDSVSFLGTFSRGDKDNKENVDCVYYFDRFRWAARATDRLKTLLDSGEHFLGESPVICFTEDGDYPCFGAFAPIADLSKRLFNMNSEIDELLRAQIFSIPTMQVPENTSEAKKLEIASTVGITVGTSNLLLYTGNQPQFIAPPDGPAQTYMQRIEAIQEEIEEIGLAVASPKHAESGISLQMRFHSINAAVSKFAGRMEDFERRAWELCRKWLQMEVAPKTSWSRNFQIADIDEEMQVLAQMNQTGMPRPIIVEQQKRIVGLQFAGSEQVEEMFGAIDEQLQERRTVPVPKEET